MAKHSPRFLKLFHEVLPRIKELTVADVQAKLARGERFLLFDVREESEWANGHLPHAERLAVFRRSAKASPTGRAETDPEKLARLSGEAFAARLSIQISETDFLVSCVASPIRDRNGACVATVSIVLPEQKVIANRALYGDAVMRASARVEQRLGWASN